MVKQHDNSTRRRKGLVEDDGGRRFDNFEHSGEFKNPLNIAERLSREDRNRYKWICSTWTLVEIPLFIILLGVLWLVGSYHHLLQMKNECRMTYIYKPMIFNPISVRGNHVDKYSLLKYHEGYRDESVLNIDIPVLFVPGSSGSAKQIRSIATTLLNSTAEMGMKFKSRFVFYACDFDEEFSFLSGATLIRQREFVVKSIETIIKMYSAIGVKKFLLIGHSFGGTILHSLPAHRRFNPKWMDLVITLGAPINGPPFKSDFYMEKFYEQTIKAWDLHSTELSHVTLVSYSGGIKDFMVPDHLARHPFMYTNDMTVIAGSRDNRVISRPSWSLRDVGCDVDHNCLAWCNQLVKHISAMVIRYGLEWKHPNDGEMKSSRNVVKNFYQQQIGPEGKAPASIDPLHLFNNSMYVQQETRRVMVTKEFPYVNINLDLPQFDLIVYIRTKAVNCPLGVKANFAELTYRSSENFTTYSIQDGEWMYIRIMPIYPETSRLKGIVKIGGTPHCEYEVQSHFELTGTIYRRLMDSTTLPFALFYTLIVFAVLPLLLENKLPSPFDYIFSGLPHNFFTGVSLIGSIITIIVAIVCRHYVERNFPTFLIWVIGARLATLIITIPLTPIVRWISRFIGWCNPYVRLSSRLLLCCISVFIASININIGCAFVLFLNLFKVGPHSKNGLCLLIYSITILGSIGFAGNVRDGPAGAIQHGINEFNPNGLLEKLTIVLYYKSPHPLLFSFIASSFCFLLNISQIVYRIDTSSKDMIVGILYCILLISIRKVTNLECMAISTSYYILLFEILKDYEEIKVVDKTKVD